MAIKLTPAQQRLVEALQTGGESAYLLWYRGRGWQVVGGKPMPSTYFTHKTLSAVKLSGLISRIKFEWRLTDLGRAWRPDEANT